jgi:hypothetical protein
MATYLAFVGVGFAYLCPGSRSSVLCTTGQSFVMSNGFTLERALRAGLVYLQKQGVDHGVDRLATVSPPSAR